MAGSYADYPPPTNITSPVQPVAKRRKAPRSKNETSKGGYVEDDFVVNDDYATAFEEPRHTIKVRDKIQDFAAYESSSDDDFEPVRQAGRPRRSNKREIGPPITSDEKLEALNPIHRGVVENFMLEAKTASEKASIHGTTMA